MVRLILCLLAGVGYQASALAQSNEQTARLEIAMLRERAERLEKNGQFAACAQAYLTAYERHPQSARIDEVIYNAAICYEAALLPGEAIRSLLLIETRFPHSRLASRSLLRMATLLSNIAYYEQSASAYERFAKRYAGEKEAKNALMTAVRFRLALGHHEKAILHLERLIRFYGRRDRKMAASAKLQSAYIYEELGQFQDAQRTYEQFLASTSAKSRSQRLIANARLGSLLWKASCPQSSQHGLCLRKVSAANASSTCGDGAVSKLRVIPRTPRLAQQARQNFRNAIRLGQQGALASAETANDKTIDEATHWLGAAQFRLADDELETFLRARVPRHSLGTRADVRERWNRWLGGWITAKTEGAAQLLKRYESLRNAKRVEWSIAAAGRVGLVSEELSTLIRQFPLPARIRRDALKKQQSCQQLESKSAPLLDLSVAAYGICHHRSSKLDWPSSWSEACTTRLSVLRPQDHPRATEYHQPHFTAGYELAHAGLIKEAYELRPR